MFICQISPKSGNFFFIKELKDLIGTRLFLTDFCFCYIYYLNKNSPSHDHNCLENKSNT